MQREQRGQSPGPPEAEVKAVVVGDGGCGKTSLLVAFARGDFPKVPTPHPRVGHGREWGSRAAATGAASRAKGDGRGDSGVTRSRTQGRGAGGRPVWG